MKTRPQIQGQLLSLLKERPTGATTPALTALIGCDRRALRRAAEELIADGKVVGTVDKRQGFAAGAPPVRYYLAGTAPATGERLVGVERGRRTTPAPKVEPPKTGELTERQALLIEARALLQSQAVVLLVLPGRLTDEQVELATLRAGVSALRGLAKP